MSKGLRIVVLVVAVAIVVVVFLLVRPSDEGPTPTTSRGGATTSTEASQSDVGKPEAKQRSEPAVTRIDVVDGEPKGGVAKIEVDTGESIEFTVTSDLSEEIHVHGFDLSEEVGPGQEAAFDFPADLEGIYEVELENSAVPIAELRVNP